MKIYSLHHAVQTAVELGAVESAVDLFPKRQFEGVDTFAHYFFGPDGREICHWLPHMFGEMFIHPQPREWGPDQLDALHNRRSLESWLDHRGGAPTSGP